MTDPVTNVEIEDVLSSIRRLVSEKARPEARVAPVASDPKPQAYIAPVEKLVLTPALRVAEPATESDISESDETEISLNQPIGDQTSRPFVLEMPADDLSDEIENRHQDDKDALAIPKGSKAQPEPDVTIGLAFDETLETTHQLAEAPAADESLVTEWNKDADQGVSVEADDEAEERARQEGPDTLQPQREASQTDPMQEDASDEPVEITDQPGHLSSALESRIAGWEAVVANADDAYEPAAAGEDDYAGTEVESLPWQDHSDPVSEHQGRSRGNHSDTTNDEAVSEDHVAEEMVVEAVASEVTEKVQGYSDDTYIDEEALRDLVGEIVRQELQGALGERITRNVRKLVRREIHRALSASGLD